MLVQVSRSFAATFLLNGLNCCKKRKDGGFRLESTEDTEIQDTGRGTSNTLFNFLLSARDTVCVECADTTLELDSQRSSWE